MVESYRRVLFMSALTVLDTPMRRSFFGAGLAIVGEMGDATDARFTALGDTVNVAARLQGLTKTLGCVAVVSEAVYQAARVAPAQIRDVAVDGRSEAVRVNTLGRL